MSRCLVKTSHGFFALRWLEALRELARARADIDRGGVPVGVFPWRSRFRDARVTEVVVTVAVLAEAYRNWPLKEIQGIAERYGWEWTP